MPTVQTFEEMIKGQSRVKGVPSFEEIIATDDVDTHQEPEPLHTEEINEIIESATQLQQPFRTVVDNWPIIKDMKIADPKDLGLPTTPEEYREMQLQAAPEATGVLSKLFAYEAAAKPDHYWNMNPLQRQAFDIYMAGRHLLTRIGGTMTTEMGLTKKEEIQKLYDDELANNPKWYQKSPELVGWGVETAAEFYALKTLFAISGLHKALTWAGMKASHSFITKEIVTRGGVKVLPTLSKQGIKKLTYDGMASFLRFAPENTAFLSSWAAGSAALKGEDPSEAAISGGLWGIGFSAILPLAGGLGKIAIATKSGQRFQRFVSQVYTDLWVNYPRFMNMGRRAFSDEFLAKMEQQYKARFGVDPSAADKAMMKKWSRMVGQEITRKAQRDAAMKAYWESGKVVAKEAPAAKPPVEKPKAAIEQPTEAIIQPPVAPKAGVKPKKGAIIPPKPSEAKPEAKVPAAEKPAKVVIPEKYQKVLDNKIKKNKYRGKTVSGYANVGIALFEEEKLAKDLGISVDKLRELVPIKIIDQDGINLPIEPTAKQLKAAIPRIMEYKGEAPPLKAKPAPAKAVGEKAVEKVFYTSVPEEWRGQTLYDWGQKGLRAQGNKLIKVKGQKPRKTFIWQGEFDKVPVGVPKTLREIKKRTDEVWPVKERRGKFWTTAYYLAPKRVVSEVKEELGAEAFKPKPKAKKPTISETAHKRVEQINHKAQADGLLALDDNEFEVFLNKNNFVPDNIDRHEAGFVDFTPVAEGYERAHDWILTFGEVKRTEPELYNKLMKSFAERSAAAERAISEVEATILSGERLSEHENAQLSLIYEDKKLFLPDELTEYAELFDKATLLMDRLEQLSIKEGIIQRPFQERMIEELTERRETLRAKLKHPAASRQIQELTAQITALKNMRYLPHAVVARRVIENQLLTLKGEERKVFIDKLSRITSKFKQRKGKFFLRDYLVSGLISESDIGFTKLITESLADYYHRSSLKSLFDFAKEKKYVKPLSLALRKEGWLNQREIGIISPELKDQLVHPILASALAEMKDMRRGRVGLTREIFAMAKMGQFIKPTIIWIYNTVQKYMRGMYSLNPVREATSLARALQSVITKDSLYHNLNASNLYQFPYEVSRASKQEQIQMFIRKHQKETNRLVSLTERAMGKSLAKEDINTFRKFAKMAIPFAHRFVANSLTWTGDKVQRTQSYLVLRKMGYPHDEAVDVASKSHVAYSTISHKFKKKMSPIVFVYSFRLLAPIEVAKTIVEPMVAAGEYVYSKGKTRPPKHKIERWAKALAGSVIIPILVDTYMQERGFEPEGKHLDVPILPTFAWKYKKIVEVDGEEREIVVGLNYILNLVTKYWNRLTYDNPISPEAQFQDALERTLKWEVHPIWRIFFWDIQQNKRSFGTGLNVYDPQASLPIQIGQTAKYIFGQTFRFWGGMMDAIGEGEMTDKERTEQEKIFDEALTNLDKFLFTVFGYKYIRLPLEERQSIMALKLMEEFKSRAFNINRRYESNERDDRLKDLEKWYERCETWIRKEMK